ncbi:hypothetical protein AWB82_07133 [Caballeronia glebae]|uniref:Uncharacterized protein n=1 Tax=Caballeronia glebae TaxID=1777143 RepID=A0A158DS47_9BURK|nr:hypothetical protein AWB82_07133 [Caballeronia glebae]
MATDCVPFTVTTLPMIVPVFASVALWVETVSPSMRPWFVIVFFALTVVLAEFRSPLAWLSTLFALTVNALTAASVPWFVNVPVVVKLRSRLA